MKKGDFGAISVTARRYAAPVSSSQCEKVFGPHAAEVIACSRSLTSRRTPPSDHLEQAIEVNDLERGLEPIEMEVNTVQP